MPPTSHALDAKAGQVRFWRSPSHLPQGTAVTFFRSLFYAAGLGLAGFIVGLIVCSMLDAVGLRFLTPPIIFLCPIAGFVCGVVLAGKKETAVTGKRTRDVLALVGATSEGTGVYSASGPGWGIAVNGRTQQLALISGGNSKVYGFSDVRKWEASFERPGHVSNAVNIASALAADAANLRMQREAKANTGLFITVRDVDHPIWRIPLLDKTQQNRWMEILRQTINNA
jgi:hypothetical protein